MRASRVLGMLGLGLTLLAAPVVAVESDDVDPVDEEQIESQAMDELLLNREQYFYSSFGRRDPFGSLLKGQFSKTEDGDVLDIGELSMVGVVWGEEDKFAVVEDKRGHSHVLREGDRVVNGRVLRITQTSLTVQHYFFGETSNVTIYMNEGEGSYVAP